MFCLQYLRNKAIHNYSFQHGTPTSDHWGTKFVNLHELRLSCHRRIHIQHPPSFRINQHYSKSSFANDQLANQHNRQLALVDSNECMHDQSALCITMPAILITNLSGQVLLSYTASRDHTPRVSLCIHMYPHVAKGMAEQLPSIVESWSNIFCKTKQLEEPSHRISSQCT